MILTEFLSYLENVKLNGNQYTARCPAHDDNRNSLSISQSGNKILVNCFAGCSTDEICESISLETKDLFYDLQVNGHKTHETHSKVNPQNKPKEFKREEICAYDYRDENGELIYQNIRFLVTFDDETTDKDFRARRFDRNGREIWNLKDVRRIPYRLPQLISALRENPSRIIILTEGEKDADNLSNLDIVTSSFKNWKLEFNQFITEANVVLLVDHDKSGIRQAADAARIIHKAAASLRVVDLYTDEPLLEKHGRDVSDWLETHYRDELREIIKIAPLWKPTDETEDFEETRLKPFPQPDEKCFHNLAGEFVRLIESHTEADRMALLVQFLIYFGNIIGRSAYYQVEADKHYTNLFSVLVGDTASGRKGTSFGRVKQIFEGEDEAYEKDCVVSGLASGEGLLWHIRDAVFVEKTDRKTKRVESVCTDAGVSDKRFLGFEGEFAQVLRVQKREGNTLSALLRNLWDKGTARNLTKNSPLRTTDAHVSIIGHITKTELLDCASDVDWHNGYANRFLWIIVRRSELRPFIKEIDFDKLAEFKWKLSEKIRFAQTVGRMSFTPEAKELYASIYQRLETSRFGLLAKITNRASPYVLRLSCIFALLDGKAEIDCEHLEAAVAVWQYAEDSARYIFGDSLGNKNADTILNALRNTKNGVTRSEIRNLFDRHLSKEKIDAALQFLLENNLARFEKEETKGRTKEIWYACVLSDKSDNGFENETNEQAFVAFVA